MIPGFKRIFQNLVFLRLQKKDREQIEKQTNDEKIKIVDEEIKEIEEKIELEKQQKKWYLNKMMA